jgi:hypothetical protein
VLQGSTIGLPTSHRQRATRLLSSRLDARLDGWPLSGRQHPPKYDAYLLFAAGLEDFTGADAIEHFDRAVAIDSGLMTALSLSFVAYLNPPRPYQ